MHTTREHKINALILAIVLSVWAGVANALEFSESTQTSSRVFSQGVNVYGDFKEGLTTTPWSWGTIYNFSRLTDPSVPSLSDETTEVTGLIDWSPETTAWGVSTEFVWSTTPAEDLSSSGVNFSLSRNFSSSSSAIDEIDGDDDGDEDSAPLPFLILKVSGGRRSYVEMFKATRASRLANPILARPKQGSNDIEQANAGLSIRWLPNDRWKVDLAYSYFFYDRNIATFMDYLDTPRSVQSGQSDFSNSVGGFPLANVTLGAKFDWTHKFNLALSETYSTGASDLLSTSATRAVVGWRPWAGWRISFGAEYSSSSQSSDVSEILSLEWRL